MRPQKVDDAAILAGLTQVFRSKGYEGASLNELAEATGLKKASLYHRFPNGKQEMAEAVLVHISEWVENHIFQALANDEEPPHKRLRNGLKEIKMLYSGGRKACVFRALSMQTGLELFSEQVEQGMSQWILAFYDLGIAFGFSKKKARDVSTQTLIDIQGSLIVAKGLGDISIFRQALRRIESYYSVT